MPSLGQKYLMLTSVERPYGRTEEVQHVCGKKQPLSSASLLALRDEYTRTMKSRTLCEDFDARAVAEAVEQVFAILPGKTEGPNVGHSET